MTNRREFLQASALAGGALVTGALAPMARAQANQASAATHARSILILGGTGFIGPHLVRHAVSRGHRVTIFTRGRRTPDLPAGVTKLVGDRNGQLDALKGGRWDVVIDDSATNPDWVRQSAELLRDAAGRYLFTSSTGVYYPYLTRGLDENVAPHTDLKDPKDGSEDFGVRKALCEQQVQRVFGDRAIVSRPTYIIGPGDTTDRFPYWPVRLARGGDVVAPGKPDDPVAFIDVRDLAEFMVKLVEDGRTGTFNVVGPKTPMAAREFYLRAQKAINPAARLVFVDDYDLLSQHGIDGAVPWVMLKGNDYGHQSVKNDKVIAAGLQFRPIEQTLADTAAWWPSVPEARRTSPRFAITPEAEARVLAAWRARG
jgi:2'-hydroxyisoflavone reductase